MADYTTTSSFTLDVGINLNTDDAEKQVHSFVEDINGQFKKDIDVINPDKMQHMYGMLRSGMNVDMRYANQAISAVREYRSRSDAGASEADLTRIQKQYEDAVKSLQALSSLQFGTASGSFGSKLAASLVGDLPDQVQVALDKIIPQLQNKATTAMAGIVRGRMKKGASISVDDVVNQMSLDNEVNTLLKGAFKGAKINGTTRNLPSK